MISLPQVSGEKGGGAAEKGISHNHWIHPIHSLPVSVPHTLSSLVEGWASAGTGGKTGSFPSASLQLAAKISFTVGAECWTV